uniref:Calpain, small subunit 1 b n=1 Tax=Paramormyrops kingsleyae TaxID=1676925 RepID=A0A3B3RSU5_9TELE
MCMTVKNILQHFSNNSSRTNLSIVCKFSIHSNNQGDSTGKLGFHEFKYLWNNIKRWQGIYKTYDADRSGTIEGNELPKAFRAAGFPLNDQLFQMIARRYSDENGSMDFDNYIGCLVRLDAMCRAFKTLDKDNNGTVNVNIQEVKKNTHTHTLYGQKYWDTPFNHSIQVFHSVYITKCPPQCDKNQLLSCCGAI